MEVVAEISAMRLAADRARASGARVGLVPTMGALHDGHLSLVRHVRARTDLTVVSIFVNPTQFGPGEDLTRYPRNLQRDCELLAAEGVDLAFAPPAEAMYPGGARTFVEVAGMSDTLEGRSRPGHFRGVATVVAKLFGIVAPHLAVFGQKDAQQAVIIRRMVADLMMGVDVVVLPTCRDEDGVALSSRNVYLSPDERRAARAIPGALDAAQAAWQAGEREPAALVAAARATIDREPLLRVDYLALVGADSLEPATRAQAEAGTGLLLAMAVFAGATRLIDNTLWGREPRGRRNDDVIRQMLRAKVHRVTVTERDVDYEGSLTLDRDLMDACAMVPFERVEVYDVDNGSRFATYLIEGEPGSGVCCLNGAAAHLVEVGHKVILATYCSVHEAEVRAHQPVVVMVDARNRATAVKRQEAAGVKVPE